MLEKRWHSGKHFTVSPSFPQWEFSQAYPSSPPRECISGVPHWNHFILLVSHHLTILPIIDVVLFPTSSINISGAKRLDVK